MHISVRGSFLDADFPATGSKLHACSQDSAGTAGYHVGEPPYGPMQAAARARGRVRSEQERLGDKGKGASSPAGASSSHLGRSDGGPHDAAALSGGAYGRLYQDAREHPGQLAAAALHKMRQYLPAARGQPYSPQGGADEYEPIMGHYLATALFPSKGESTLGLRNVRSSGRSRSSEIRFSKESSRRPSTCTSSG